MDICKKGSVKIMKWKNETLKDEVVSSSIEIGTFHLSVHHYTGCSAAWFVSCNGIFNKILLGEMSLCSAQAMALDRLQMKFEKAIKLICVL